MKPLEIDFVDGEVIKKQEAPRQHLCTHLCDYRHWGNDGAYLCKYKVLDIQNVWDIFYDPGYCPRLWWYRETKVKEYKREFFRRQKI